MLIKCLVRAVASMLLAVPSAWAEDAPLPKIGFDCWIATRDPYYQIHYIFCIEDRGAVQSGATPDAPELSPLDEIHRLLHEGTLEELDRFVQDSAWTLGPGDVRRIRITSYPAQWSWDEERPQMLAETLCPPGYECSVYIRRE